MRLKALFTVPTGQKVTEKHLRRVLISSICSILLCMTCLTGTTWAWFTVSIENTENVIQIATVTADVSITDSENNTVDKSSDNQYELQAGTYAIEVNVENDTTDWSRPVYVLMSMVNGEEPDYYYFSFVPDSSESQRIKFCCSETVTVSFSASWMEPVSAVSIGDEAVTVPPATEVTANPGETTAPATEETTIPSATDSTVVPATTPTVIPTESVAEPEATTIPTETG